MEGDIVKAKPKYIRFFILSLIFVFLAYKIPNSIEGIEEEISEISEEIEDLESEHRVYILSHGTVSNEIQREIANTLGDKLRLYDRINFRDALQMPLYYVAIATSVIGAIQLLRAKKQSV